jgi:hypothetical protein
MARLLCTRSNNDEDPMTAIRPEITGSKPAAPASNLLTPKDAARLLKVSTSFLAKRRMAGDGPPYIKVGRSIRYTDVGIAGWMRSRQRMSTGETL